MNGLYVGTFDPITVGHLDIIKRAADMFDKLYVLVSNNSAKHTLLAYNQREYLVKLALQDIPNVEYLTGDVNKTTPDIMSDNNIRYIVRGARNVADLQYEHSLYEDYLKINPDIEEILLWSKVDVSSTFIRECIKFHKWDVVKKYVPAEVADELVLICHG